MIFRNRDAHSNVTQGEGAKKIISKCKPWEDLLLLHLPSTHIIQHNIISLIITNKYNVQCTYLLLIIISKSETWIRVLDVIPFRDIPTEIGEVEGFKALYNFFLFSLMRQFYIGVSRFNRYILSVINQERPHP